jgi:hypothetical protein
MFTEIFPGFNWVSSVTSVTTLVTTKRYLFGGQQLVEISICGYTQTVGKR